MPVESDWPHAYLAHHGVEPLVDVSELRSQTLDLDGTDDQPATRLKRLARLPAPARRTGVGRTRPGLF